MAQKRAVIYTRVSGRRQEARNQLPDCRRYCHDNNFVIVAEIEDKIKSITAVKDRPGGKQVYDLLRKKAVDVVVMWVIDRVARDEDIVEYGLFKRDIKRAGAKLHFTDRGETADDPIAAQSELAEAAGAAKERLKIISRAKAGRYRKFVEDQRLVMTGQIPFGYRRNGSGKESYLAIDPVESVMVKDLFHWYADHVPMSEIVSRVVESGIPTKNGGQWSKSGIVSMLRYSGYRGSFVFGKDTLDKPELAIIDPVTWHAVQDLLGGNRWQKTSNPGQYLLSGQRVKCFCGATMTGATAYATAGGGKKLYRYYRCGNGHNLTKDHPKRCGKMIRADKLDKLAWGWLILLAMSPDHIDDLFDEARKNIERDTKPIQERINSLKEALRENEAEIERLVKRLSKTDDDFLIGKIEKESAELADSRKRIQNSIDRAEGELAKFGAIPGGRIDKRAMERELNRLVGAKTFEDRRHSIEYFDVSAELVKMRDGKIKIRLGCYLFSDEDLFDLEGYPAYIHGVEIVESDNRQLWRKTQRKGIWIHEILSLDER